MSKRSLPVLLVLTALNLIYNAFLPLHPDEAYYWTWSRDLGLSYFDHPPLIAYLIRLTTLAGHSEFAIRLVSVICMTLAASVVYRLARSLFDERVADTALLVMLFMPVTQVGYLVVTPDAPLILFWSLTVYGIHIGLQLGKERHLYWAGTCAGFTLLSKYTGILLFPAVVLFIASSRHRTVLLRPNIYLAALLAFVLFSPVIVWNAQHDWASFRFQLMHGMGGDKALRSGDVGSFFAGQALVVNPIFLLALFYYALRYVRVNTRDEKLAFLLWPFLLTFAFFLCGAFFKKSEANWAAPAYITGAVLLAYWIEKDNRRWIKYGGVALTVAMVVLMKFPEAFPHLPEQMVLKRQFMGYREIFQQGTIYTRDRGSTVLSDSHQDASEARYYLGNQPEVYIVTPARISQYDFWRDDLPRSGMKDAVFFGNEEHLPELRRIYSDVRLIAVLHYENRYVEREMTVYRCRGFKH